MTSLEMEVSVTSSDVAMLSVIRTLRNVSLNISEALAMSTYIADNILAHNCCKQYREIDDFVQGFKMFLLPSTFSFFYDAIRVFNFDLFDSIQSLLSQEQQTSPNRAAVPSLIKRDSLVGVYVRVLCTKWNALSFSSIGDIVDNYSKFCNNISPIYSNLQFPYESSFDINIGSTGHIVAAEKAMMTDDTFLALKYIHVFFDDLDAEQIKICGSSDFTTSCSTQVIRQQEAMLSLATMWIKNEQFSQAIIATEEGMRMSHQLGDHTSVARALLLLHHVVDRLPEKEESDRLEGAPSAESVLIRCIQRCTELNLRGLEAQAILLLVRLRTKGPLQNLKSKLQLSGSIVSIEEEYIQYRSTSKQYSKHSNLPHHSRVPPCALWTLLSSALLMESLYSSAVNISDSDSTYHHKKCTFVEQKEDPSGDLLSMMELLGHTGLVSGSLWDRLGILAMTELSCKRTLRQCGIFLPVELVGHLCVGLSTVRSKSQTNGSMITLSHVLLHYIIKDRNETHQNTQALQRCFQAEQLLQLASKNLLCACDYALRISRIIEVSRCLVKVRESLYSSDLSCEMNLKAILQMSHCSALSQSESTQTHLLYFEAAILRCFILSFLSKDQMLQSLAAFEDERLLSSVVLRGERKILKAIAILVLEPNNVSEGLSVLHDICEYSMKEYVPQCDASLSVLTGLLALPRTMGFC